MRVVRLSLITLAAGLRSQETQPEIHWDDCRCLDVDSKFTLGERIEDHKWLQHLHVCRQPVVADSVVTSLTTEYTGSADGAICKKQDWTTYTAVITDQTALDDKLNERRGCVDSLSNVIDPKIVNDVNRVLWPARTHRFPQRYHDGQKRTTFASKVRSYIANTLQDLANEIEISLKAITKFQSEIDNYDKDCKEILAGVTTLMRDISSRVHMHGDECHTTVLAFGQMKYELGFESTTEFHELSKVMGSCMHQSADTILEGMWDLATATYDDLVKAIKLAQDTRRNIDRTEMLLLAGQKDLSKHDEQKNVNVELMKEFETAVANFQTSHEETIETDMTGLEHHIELLGEKIDDTQAAFQNKSHVDEELRSKKYACDAANDTFHTEDENVNSTCAAELVRLAAKKVAADATHATAVEDETTQRDATTQNVTDAINNCHKRVADFIQATNLATNQVHRETWSWQLLQYKCLPFTRVATEAHVEVMKLQDHFAFLVHTVEGDESTEEAPRYLTDADKLWQVVYEHKLVDANKNKLQQQWYSDCSAFSGELARLERHFTECTHDDLCVKHPFRSSIHQFQLSRCTTGRSRGMNDASKGQNVNQGQRFGKCAVSHSVYDEKEALSHTYNGCGRCQPGNFRSNSLAGGLKSAVSLQWFAAVTTDNVLRRREIDGAGCFAKVCWCEDYRGVEISTGASSHFSSTILSIFDPRMNIKSANGNYGTETVADDQTASCRYQGSRRCAACQQSTAFHPKFNLKGGACAMVSTPAFITTVTANSFNDGAVEFDIHQGGESVCSFRGGPDGNHHSALNECVTDFEDASVGMYDEATCNARGHLYVDHDKKSPMHMESSTLSETNSLVGFRKTDGTCTTIDGTHVMMLSKRATHLGAHNCKGADDCESAHALQMIYTMCEHPDSVLPYHNSENGIHECGRFFQTGQSSYGAQAENKCFVGNGMYTGRIRHGGTWQGEVTLSVIDADGYKVDICQVIVTEESLRLNGVHEEACEVRFGCTETSDMVTDKRRLGKYTAAKAADAADGTKTACYADVMRMDKVHGVVGGNTLTYQLSAIHLRLDIKSSDVRPASGDLTWRSSACAGPAVLAYDRVNERHGFVHDGDCQLDVAFECAKDQEGDGHFDPAYDGHRSACSDEDEFPECYKEECGITWLKDELIGEKQFFCDHDLFKGSKVVSAADPTLLQGTTHHDDYCKLDFDMDGGITDQEKSKWESMRTVLAARENCLQRLYRDVTDVDQCLDDVCSGSVNTDEYSLKPTCQMLFMNWEAELVGTQDEKVKSAIAKALGDPHVVNMNRESFEIEQPGEHLFLQIPRGQAIQKTYLQVFANVHGKAQRACENLYIWDISLSGRWLVGFDVMKIHGSMHRGGTPSVQFDGSGRHDFLAAGNITKSVNVVSQKKLSVVANQVRMTVWAEHGGFLNLNVFGLGKVKHEVGGLLGRDDHAEESKKRRCPKKSNLFLLGEGDAGRSTVSVMTEE